MRILRADLEVCAFKNKQFPENDPGEIAFAGRSNVGKSSLLNKIMGRRKLVKVSSRPGFTQSINFFSVSVRQGDQEGNGYLVDLPGYGYAKAPRSVIKRWERLIGDYFSSGRRILAVVTIFDIRRTPDHLDLELVSFLRFHSIPIVPVFNKCDKLSGSSLFKRTRDLWESLGRFGFDEFDDTSVFCVSARTGAGIERLKQEIFSSFL
ncbi:GTP-binding protein EngB [Dissulfuribacter thermophilus]|uniref:Probable GTP-binding protein EngB n=1 Tax=Dissulfuribacter thermophilus TaxID=1156395 RepID=A0A1B9F9E4_9BACT|nr:ribosome biogenesis GTP-binding protein YihA/YsxC [Dissulfuribacter thermophilus]OCC16530.1 GTP-binding protein EngB [Dissulfuribacter thermophilus]